MLSAGPRVYTCETIVSISVLPLVCNRLSLYTPSLDKSQNARHIFGVRASRQIGSHGLLRRLLGLLRLCHRCDHRRLTLRAVQRAARLALRLYEVVELLVRELEGDR